MTASQDALKKVEVVRKASEHSLEEALVKVEQSLKQAAEESIPRIVTQKIIASRQFLVYSIIMLVISVVAAVCMSIGLSYLVR